MARPSAQQKAYEALGDILPEHRAADHTVVKLRRDLDEYATYLEGATWWRDKGTA